MPRIAEGNKQFEEKEGMDREREKDHADVVDGCFYYVISLFLFCFLLGSCADVNAHCDGWVL